MLPEDWYIEEKASPSIDQLNQRQKLITKFGLHTYNNNSNKYFFPSKNAPPKKYDKLFVLEFGATQPSKKRPS